MIEPNTVLWLCVPVLFGIAVVQVLRRSSFLRTVAALALGGYAVALVAVTLFPFPTHDITIMRTMGFGPMVNVVPLGTIRDALASGSSTAVRQVVGNALLLAPLAILLPLLWPRLARWKRIIPICLAVSCAIELVQLGVSSAFGIRYKSFDVDDILLNTLGSILGFAVFLLGRRIFQAIQPATAEPRTP